MPMRSRPKSGGAVLFAMLLCGVAIAQPPSSPAQPEQQPAQFPGMDQTVNVDLAKQAGAPVRKPYIDVESLGDLWNLILLSGGAVCGFVVGRNWDQIWGRRKV
jgi:hypothetical protein